MSFKFKKTKKSFTYNSYKNLYNLSMNHCDIVNFTEILGRFWIFKKRIRSKFYLRPFSWRKLFSSPKPKVHVSFSYQLMSVICLSFLSFLSCVKINIILIIIVPGRHEILYKVLHVFKFHQTTIHSFSTVLL